MLRRRKIRTYLTRCEAFFPFLKTLKYHSMYEISFAKYLFKNSNLIINSASLLTPLGINFAKHRIKKSLAPFHAFGAFHCASGFFPFCFLLLACLGQQGHFHLVVGSSVNGIHGSQKFIALPLHTFPLFFSYFCANLFDYFVAFVQIELSLALFFFLVIGAGIYLLFVDETHLSSGI